MPRRPATILTFTWCLVALAVFVALFAATLSEASSSSSSHDDHDDHGIYDAHDDHDDHAAEGADANAGEDAALVEGLKVMSMGVLFAASITLALIVIFLPSCHANKTLLSLGAAFSAGVFLTVGLTHMLGEATMILLEHYGQAESERFRHPFVMATVGYLVMVLIQRGIFADAHAAVHDHALHSHPPKATHDNHHTCEKGAQKEVCTEPISPSSPYNEEGDNNGPTKCNECQEDEMASTTSTCDSTIEVVATLENTEHRHDDEKDNKPGGASVVATMLALCIHSALEGTALGLQTTKEGVLLLFIAIITHQWAEDFAVSVATGRAKLPKLHRSLLSLLLAVACPFGVGIGWWMQSAIPSAATGYLLAFSTGCFISIACTELIPGEINGGLFKSWKQLVAVFAGSGMLYLVMVMMYEEKAHDH